MLTSQLHCIQNFKKLHISILNNNSVHSFKLTECFSTCFKCYSPPVHLLSENNPHWDNQHYHSTTVCHPVPVFSRKPSPVHRCQKMKCTVSYNKTESFNPTQTINTRNRHKIHVSVHHSDNSHWSIRRHHLLILSNVSQTSAVKQNDECCF